MRLFCAANSRQRIASTPAPPSHYPNRENSEGNNTGSGRGGRASRRRARRPLGARACSCRVPGGRRGHRSRRRGRRGRRRRPRPAVRCVVGPATGSRPPSRRDRRRSACVVNARLLHTVTGASDGAPPCVVSRVEFSVSQTSSAWARGRGAAYCASVLRTSAGVRSGDAKGSITRTVPNSWPCCRSSVRRTLHWHVCAVATMRASHQERE